MIPMPKSFSVTIITLNAARKREACLYLTIRPVERVSAPVATRAGGR